ncbi:MAG: cation:proton antiporter [Magnetococcales bacterium]|nr:cation:proton antiporter [Magnetococcales bacterium]
MDVNLAQIIIFGLLADYLFRKIRLPGLLGMLLVGILCGPYVFNILSQEFLAVSADMRLIALIVILLRAGLKLRRDMLKRVGNTALLVSTIPALFEGVVVAVVAPILFDITHLEGAIIGAILAAVSPAVVVPFMLNLMQHGYGTRKGIPTMMLGASAVNDVFAIVIFSIFLGFYNGQGDSIAIKLLGIPESIILGILLGLIVGWLLNYFFTQFKPSTTKMTLAIIAISGLMIWLERVLADVVRVSALLAVMAVGFYLLEKCEERAHDISVTLSKVWVVAEIILFTLVGAQVNIHVALDTGLLGVGLIAVGLLGRSISTWLCFSGTIFNKKERLFCVVSYIPKATVQAAIGAVPLEAGIPGGEIILTIAVLSIIITAPLGAIGMAVTGKRWLEKEPDAKTVIM